MLRRCGWLLGDMYNAFTEKQPEGARLSRESWTALQEWIDPELRSVRLENVIGCLE